MSVPRVERVRRSPTGPSCWGLAATDLQAMAEGRHIGRGQLALRIALHQRYRAAIRWRLAHRCMANLVLKPIGLWLTGRTLATSGAELQPTASIGAGLILKHTTGLVVGGEVVAGRGLVLHQNVTLGDRRPYGGQPRIGNDVTVGAGACVLGPITIGDGAVVAANSVVLADVPPGAVVAGNPARLMAGGGDRADDTGHVGCAVDQGLSG